MQYSGAFYSPVGATVSRNAPFNLGIIALIWFFNAGKLRPFWTEMRGFGKIDRFFAPRGALSKCTHEYGKNPGSEWTQPQSAGCA